MLNFALSISQDDQARGWREVATSGRIRMSPSDSPHWLVIANIAKEKRSSNLLASSFGNKSPRVSSAKCVGKSRILDDLAIIMPCPTTAMLPS